MPQLQHARSDTTSKSSSYTMLQPELISAALSMGGRHTATAPLQQKQVRINFGTEAEPWSIRLRPRGTLLSRQKKESSAR